MNCPIAKSLAFAASLPSRPWIPIPTCDSVIIDTSFAPSPIASVIADFSASFMRQTNSYFSLGVTLQPSTHSHFNKISVNSGNFLSYFICSKAYPDITKTKFDFPMFI